MIHPSFQLVIEGSLLIAPIVFMRLRVGINNFIVDVYPICAKCEACMNDVETGKRRAA